MPAAEGRLRRSAFFRFAVALPLLVGTLAALLMWPIYREAVGYIRSEVRAAIERDGWDLEVEFHEHGLAGLVARIDERVQRELDPGDLYLLVDERGQRLAGNLESWPPAASAEDRAWVEFSTVDGRAAEGQVYRLFGRRALLVARLSPLASFDRHLAERLAWTAAAMLALAAMAAAWFTWRLRRRLRALAADADAIRAGDLGRRLPVARSGDEIDALAERFNAAFADLQRLVDGMREVASHLAHDLRRPLQAARQRLEELAHSPGLQADARRALESSLAEIDQLLSTFAALLRLARLQSGAYERSQEWLQLDRVLADAVELYAPVAAAGGRRLHANIAACRLQADRHLVFQLLQNLIENALQHGAGDIEIELAASGRLSVRDHGPGVPPDSLARLGERFFRADPARSGTGSGIGLALARAIAGHHGARIEFANADPGFRVTLTWAPGASDRRTQPDSADSVPVA